MKRMNRLLSSAVTGLLLMLGLVSMPALARGLAAQAGAAENPADASCFRNLYGAVSNQCSTTRQYTVPLPVDYGNTTYTATVTAYAASSSNTVGCAVCGLDITTKSRWCSPVTYLSQYGVDQSFTVAAYMPAVGQLYVSCYISPGGWLDSVHW